MPTLNIGGKSVTVGDEFSKLSPEQQNAAVDEIAKSLGTQGATEQQPPAQSQETVGWLAPVAKDSNGNWHPAVPQIVHNLIDAFKSATTYPGDVAAGRAAVPSSDNGGENIGRVVDLATLGLTPSPAMGTGAGIARAAGLGKEVPEAAVTAAEAAAPIVEAQPAAAPLRVPPQAASSAAADTVATADAQAQSASLRRAGNINLDRIFAPEDVKDAIKQQAADNAGFMDARRGVIGFDQTRELASLTGMSPDKLAERTIGQTFNAEQLFASRQLLVDQATKVRDLARIAQGGSDLDKAQFAEAITRLRAIQEQVSGATAEAGRALSQFRMLAGASKEEIARVVDAAKTGGLEDMAAKINSLDDPAQVAQFTANAFRAKTSDMIIEAWINALLSGPQTHATNILSNALVSAWSLPENAVAAGISKVTGSGIQGREVFSRMAGTLEGAIDGIRAGWKAFLTEQPSDATTKLDVRKFQAIPSANIGGVEIGGKQIRIPGRLLTAEDEFFKSIAYRQEINAQATRQAITEGGSRQEVAQRIAALRAQPTEEMQTAARDFAAKQTFTNPLGDAGNAVIGFARSNPWFRVVMPFIRTPVNIVKFAAERSPIAPIMKEVRENLTGVHGPVARDEQIARIALGSSVGATAAYLAAQGLVTGGGPSDPKERALLYASGWQPYSIKIGDTYYSYSRLEPLGTLLGVSADAVQLSHAMSEDESNNVAALVMGSISKNLVSKTWLKGPSDLLDAVKDPDRYGARYVQQLVGTLVPTGVAQIARANDPYLRDARSILDTIKSRIPGERETLFLRRDTFGNPIKQNQLGPALASPIFTSQAKNDPAIAEMLRLDVTPGQLSRKIRGVDLEPREFDQYSFTAGRLMKAGLDTLVHWQGWRSLPDAAKQQLMTDAINKSRDLARDFTISKFPDLALRIKSAAQEKIDALKPAGALH